LSDGSSTLTIQTPRVFLPLLEPARYKGAYGGRGSGKSHFFAEALIERCLLKPTRAVCIREIQRSLAESVKRLLEDKIQKLGVGRYFRILESHIDAPHGGIIIFQGMQNHTAESIKSLEGYEIAWGEEAHTLSARSLELLIPTIRAPGSELWFSWNPNKATDPVDALFRGEGKIEGDDVKCVEARWQDNPWFPEVLRRDMLRDKDRDFDKYCHVWLGEYLSISDALIFRNRVSFETFETPSDVRFYFGADWGFANDPTVVTRSWVKDECLFIDYEAFGYHVEIDDTPALFTGVPGSKKWPIKADSARPETISFMRRAGFDISAAEKWSGSVEDGIAYLKGFKRIVIHERCQELMKEARLYSYKVDPRTGDVLPIIVDKHNHGWDAVRYSLDGYIRHKGPMKISNAMLDRAANPGAWR
jgi:phage terminase large subunit